MNHLMACRVCLAYDIRLHSISGCQLQDIYEKFTETLLETGDMKPTCVCYICFSLLKKFQKFIEKSKKSNQLLEQMINSGLELSVNDLELFCKQQTEFPWTLDKSPMVRVISATEEEVKMETPIKTEYVNSEMDVGDQNEVSDDLDDITLELKVTNQNSSSDSEDNLPLQNISKQWKADQSNVAEIRTSEILTREIMIFKEEQLQQMLERSKSLNYQNSLIKCDLCCKEFVDVEAFENHQKKHAEVLHLPKKRKPDNETEQEILKRQAPLKNLEKGEENKAQNEDTRKIPDFRKRSNTFITPYIVLVPAEIPIKTVIPNNETTTSNIDSDIKNSKIEANSNLQVTAPNNIFIYDDVCKKENPCKSFLNKHIEIWHKFEIEGKPNSLADSNTNYQNCKNSNLSIGKDVLKNNNVRENKFSKNKNQHKDSICRDETQYKCSYCMKCFTQSSDLAAHVRIHTGEKPYKCSYCTKCFTTSSHLARHVRIHTGEKPYKCSFCTKCFSASNALATHIKVHLGEKPYKCSYCTKLFSLRCHLNKHLRIHTGDKPYKCSYCTKLFSLRGNLNRHLRIHTGDKPYKCSYCTKLFSLRGNLNRHLRIHTGKKPYKCNYCTKCFSDCSTLAKHVRIHTGEKPYICCYCTKSFTQRGNLGKHLRIHTGEKPYKCSYCTKCFTRSGILAKHIRIHT